MEKLLDSKTVYEGRMINLRVDSIELPSGRQTTREIVEHTNSVVVVAVDSSDNVLLVRQYRTAIGQALVEVPAGKTESEEHPLQCAHRELREETGHDARVMEDMGGFYAGPGYSTEYLHLYLATDLVPVDGTVDTDEIMGVFRIPLNEIPDMIASGKICDAKSVAGLLRVLGEAK